MSASIHRLRRRSGLDCQDKSRNWRRRSFAPNSASRNDPRPDHAQYMAQYLAILKNDKKAIFTAAAAASAATDFILAFSRKEQEEAA